MIKKLQKKIDETTKVIKKNIDNSFVDVEKQIQEITKLTLSKLTAIKIKNQEIDEAIKTTQNKLVN